MPRYALIVIGLAIIAFGGRPAKTANLVLNPGFETGDFTGWNVSGDGILLDTAFPNTGCCDAAFSALTTDPNPGVLSQTLPTMAGQSYDLSFALLDEAGFSGDSFIVQFGGFATTITGDMAAPPGDLPSLYTALAFVVPGADITGDDTLLSFEGLNFPNIGIDWNLDDVSATAATSAVPEPSAASVFATVLAVSLGIFRIGERNRAQSLPEVGLTIPSS